MKAFIVIAVAAALTAAAVIYASARTKRPAVPEGFVHISAAEAKSVMDSGADCTVVDVRGQSEFDGGHIPGAVLMPHTETQKLAPVLLPDKTGCILVYCRSGRRSKIAAETLVKMGYTDVREFGGITDWPYETVK